VDEVVIHDLRGRVRGSDTVAPGSDPKPPRNREQDGGGMTTYVPFLKAKHGEFEAVGKLSTETLSRMTPMFELCPDDDLDKGMRTVVQKACKYLPAGARIAVDGSHVSQLMRRPALGNITPIEWIYAELTRAGFEVMPTARLFDAAAQRHVVVAAPGTGRAIIRVDARTTSPAQLIVELAQVPTSTGLVAEHLHVVLDIGPLRDVRDVSPASTHVEALIVVARSLGRWASVTVASGAFPQTISDMPKGYPTPVPRHDAELWRNLASLGYTINFGDYGVNDPGMRFGGRAPLPNLRYLAGRAWLIWREARTRPGNESFYDLCDRIANDRSWAGSGYSWGDAQIAAAASQRIGPGTATQWRAYGTNHHITGVADRLARLGEP
jgi:hypothetical protein